MTMLAPVCKTATIRKLKRSHAELESQEAICVQPSRPILRSASVVRTKRLQPSVSETLYKSYTDDQPNKLIFNRGQLKLVVCGSENRLAVTVLEARSIQSKFPGTTMVLEAHLLPSPHPEMGQVSEPIKPNATNINKTFTFDINERLQSGTKLFIRVYLQKKGDAEPKFVGCMSFGARKIIQEQSIIKGWYYLLSENLGRRKHLAVSKTPDIYPSGHVAQKMAIRKPVQSVCDWSNSTSSSSAFSSIVAGDINGDRRVRWRDNHMIPLPLCSTPKSPRRVPSPLFEEGFSLHGQDISVQAEQVEIKELTIRRGWCGFGFTLVGECPAKVETVFEDCVAAQVGLKSGDSILSVNGQSVVEQNAARVSEAILRTVSDLHLEVEREILNNGSSKFSKQRAQETQSPRKIQKFNFSDDEEEILDNAGEASAPPKPEIMEESPRQGRLGGMNNLLKFDECLKPLRLLADGRDFVYSGAVFATISGVAQPQRVWIILLTDMMIITEYDSMEKRYVIIEEPIRLRQVTLDYEAFGPDGTPDLTWKISIDEEQGFGPRKYTFKADTAELAAMWKCSISRQIDLARRSQVETNDRTPSRCRSEADMNAYDVAADSLPRGGSTKNRRKSFGPARIDLAFVKLVSGARETIRNRRRNSTTNALEIPRFSPFQEQAKSFDEQQEDEYFTLKSSSSSSNLAGAKGQSRKSQLQADHRFLSKHASSSNLDQMNTSGDSGEGALSGERKSLPEKVNFAATWVSAKLLKKHRERKARRLESEANLGQLPINGTSALDRLVESDLCAIRLGLADTIACEASLSAFREFLAKEHSEENLCFWLACEEYKNFEELRDEKATQILEQFILSGAEQEINIDSETKRLAISGLEASPPDALCLVKAQEHVFKLMQTDTYMRFLRTLPPLPQSTTSSTSVN